MLCKKDVSCTVKLGKTLDKQNMDSSLHLHLWVREQMTFHYIAIIVTVDLSSFICNMYTLCKGITTK